MKSFKRKLICVGNPEDQEINFDNKTYKLKVGAQFIDGISNDDFLEAKNAAQTAQDKTTAAEERAKKAEEKVEQTEKAKESAIEAEQAKTLAEQAKTSAAETRLH